MDVFQGTTNVKNKDILTYFDKMDVTNDVDTGGTESQTGLLFSLCPYYTLLFF